MSKSDKHKRGALYGKFCTVAVYKKKCSCATPSDYRENSKCPWGNPFQGHHLVPITSTESQIVSNAKHRGTVEQTQWCSNNEVNMYAMPVWGHTVKHYCRKTMAFKLTPPPYKNIPQHSSDHDLYTEEANGLLELGTDQWKKHKVTPQQIAGLLDTVGRQMRAKLVSRGSSRCGGTHAAWLAAVAAADNGRQHPGWYLPFSMAMTPRRRAFPYKGTADVRDWINRIKKALGR